jgi:hypothetical protein
MFFTTSTPQLVERDVAHSAFCTIWCPQLYECTNFWHMAARQAGAARAVVGQRVCGQRVSSEEETEETRGQRRMEESCDGASRLADVGGRHAWDCVGSEGT